MQQIQMTLLVDSEADANKIIDHLYKTVRRTDLCSLAKFAASNNIELKPGCYEITGPKEVPDPMTWKNKAS